MQTPANTSFRDDFHHFYITPTDDSSITNLTPEILQAALEANGIQEEYIIDIRTHEEWKQAHVDVATEHMAKKLEYTGYGRINTSVGIFLAEADPDNLRRQTAPFKQYSVYAHMASDFGIAIAEGDWRDIVNKHYPQLKDTFMRAYKMKVPGKEKKFQTAVFELAFSSDAGMRAILDQSALVNDRGIKFRMTHADPTETAPPPAPKGTKNRKGNHLKYKIPGEQSKPTPPSPNNYKAAPPSPSGQGK